MSVTPFSSPVLLIFSQLQEYYSGISPNILGFIMMLKNCQQKEMELHIGRGGEREVKPASQASKTFFGNLVENKRHLCRQPVPLHTH